MNPVEEEFPSFMEDLVYLSHKEEEEVIKDFVILVEAEYYC
jgi:hypothetical protein